jgi:transposase
VADPCEQAREGTGFDHSACTIDWATHIATCPQGKQSRKWQPDQDVTRQDVIAIRFAKRHCQACAVRTAYTRVNTEPRTLKVWTQVYHAALQAARQRQKTVESKAYYVDRAGIEGTLSQRVRAFDWRRSRDIGLAKTSLQHLLVRDQCGEADGVVDSSASNETTSYTVCRVGVCDRGVRQQSHCWVWC